ncbi:MAG: hypothetical protein J1E33_06590 [Alistipes sp.]|nr:hypothetical protein [Alistipes sp.]
MTQDNAQSDSGQSPKSRHLESLPCGQLFLDFDDVVHGAVAIDNTIAVLYSRLNLYGPFLWLVFE